MWKFRRLYHSKISRKLYKETNEYVGQSDKVSYISTQTSRRRMYREYRNSHMQNYDDITISSLSSFFFFLATLVKRVIQNKKYYEVPFHTHQTDNLIGLTLLWHRGLRIQCCHCSGSGHGYGTVSTPDQGTSTCRGSHLPRLKV